MIAGSFSIICGRVCCLKTLLSYFELIFRFGSASVENGKPSHADRIGLLIDKPESTAVCKLLSVGQVP